MINKILIIMFSMILLVGFVSAYTIYEDVVEDDAWNITMTYVNHTFPEGEYTYKFENYNMFCKGKWKMYFNESEGNCSQQDYYTYIDKEMKEAIKLGIPFIVPETNTDNYIGGESDKWFVKWVKWIISQFKSDIEDLKQENQILKTELCKKDQTYAFCEKG